MPHIHLLYFGKPKPLPYLEVFCEGCDIRLRVATYAEAVFVDETASYAPDGPMNGPSNTVVVPMDYSLEDAMRS